jgi:hypothetical protein
MKMQKWTASLVAAALFVGTAGTALAAPGDNVPNSVYSDDHAEGKHKDHKKVEEDLQKAGITDVSPDYWAAGSITVLVESGLIKPDADGKINPEAPLATGEGVAVFAKVLGIASKSDDAATALAKAKDAGLVDSSATTDTAFTRVAVARLLAKALGIQPKTVASPADYPFKDFGALDPADAGILAALQAAGVFEGFEDGTFRPNEVLTVAQIATLVDRILGAKQ